MCACRFAASTVNASSSARSMRCLYLLRLLTRKIRESYLPAHKAGAGHGPRNLGSCGSPESSPQRRNGTKQSRRHYGAGYSGLLGRQLNAAKAAGIIREKAWLSTFCVDIEGVREASGSDKMSFSQTSSAIRRELGGSFGNFTVSSWTHTKTSIRPLGVACNYRERGIVAFRAHHSRLFLVTGHIHQADNPIVLV